jgi:hypothetical protein
MGQDFRKQLAELHPSAAHWLLFDEVGAQPPPTNQLSVQDSLALFKKDFLPQCPIVDPRGVRVKIVYYNFPKFLNLHVRKGFQPKKPSTIVDYIAQGKFVPAEYEWLDERLQTLFWVPNVIRDPDAIYRKKRSHGLVKADEVYVKVYNKSGSKIKLVFVDRVGRYNDVIFISSYLTGAHTAVKYCDGPPVWRK